MALEPEVRISPVCLGLYSDENEAACARILKFIRDYGGHTKFRIRLAHAGRKASVLLSFMMRKFVPSKRELSPSDYEDEVHVQLKIITVPEYRESPGSGFDRQIRADRLGLNLIELHFEHDFLSP
jgi:2,4-dienoyl-CoA reductase-like NADH-dependent reductase (Old Yellow Enzyme family)